MSFGAGIIGTGAALPDNIVTNADIAKIVETNDEWIRTRTGIRQRPIAAEDECNSTFAIRAGREALERADISPEDVDFLILATISPDMPLPATACFVQAELGAINAAAFDIAAACTGFIYALSIAEKFIKDGTAQNVLIIGSEVLSKWIDWTDRSTCVLFADGAGAAVVSRVAEGRGLLSCNIRSDGNFANVLNIPGGGTREPISEQLIADRRHYIKMRGNELFKVAIRCMANSSKQALKDAGLSVDDLNLVIPHQANQRITDGVVQRLQVDNNIVYSNIDRIGNSSSATVPIGLHECVLSGRLVEGDILLLTAFGGGTTWGSAILRW